MDVHSSLDGQRFVWSSDKAASNVRAHGIRFEEAREAFLDPLARYEDASPDSEARQACLGLAIHARLLYVVHLVHEGELIRIISARRAEASERERYEDE